MKERNFFIGVTLIVCQLVFSAPTVSAQSFCKGDFNYDGAVAADDVGVFLEYFGRSPFNNPCPPDGPSPAAKTGQTTPYATGDDGDLQRGVEWPDPRWTDNGNGTVTDHLTGLIWLKNANCFGDRTWLQALSDCNGLSAGYCGLTDGSSAGDWRLPNLRELKSHIDYGVSAPAIRVTHPYINVQYTYYWTSTTFADITDNAWLVYMYSGVNNAFSKSITYYVWPVRGGR